MNEDLLLRHGWFFGSPNGINQVLTDGHHLEALFFEVLGSVFEATGPDLCRIHSNFLALLKVLREPFIVHFGLGLPLHHFPSSLKLLLSLEVVAAVSPHQGIGLCDYTDTITPTESTNVLDPLITWG